ncbi:MAG: hypothetical protein PHE84_04300 [bacterium]|nr:hypothetical protein [bacterium]
MSHWLGFSDLVFFPPCEGGARGEFRAIVSTDKNDDYRTTWPVEHDALGFFGEHQLADAMHPARAGCGLYKDFMEKRLKDRPLKILFVHLGALMFFWSALAC